MEQSRIDCGCESMSNTGYHANGKPNWWVRVGSGSDVRFLDIPKIRGDQELNIVVALPVGTKVYCGAGKGTHKTVRVWAVTKAIEAKPGMKPEECDDAMGDSNP